MVRLDHFSAALGVPVGRGNHRAYLATVAALLLALSALLHTAAAYYQAWGSTHGVMVDGVLVDVEA